jgi:uncharacterized membrane protein
MRFPGRPRNAKCASAFAVERRGSDATRILPERVDIMDYEHFVVAAARVVEFVGVAVLLLGALLAAFTFSRRLVRRATFQDAYHALRADLGRAILLGLELLVIADIIGTVAIEPTLQNLGVLAVIVAIRTLLSFALELEVSGRWPWQRAEAEGQKV